MPQPLRSVELGAVGRLLHHEEMVALADARRKHCLSQHRYVLKHPERAKESTRKYCEKSRFNERGVMRFGGQRENVLVRDGYKCCLCGMTDTEHRQKFGRSITIDHKDGNGRYAVVPNNVMSNLWTLCLPCHGKKDTQRGMDNFNAKLDDDKVRQIRKLVKTMTCASIGRLFDIDIGTIVRIKNGKRWTHVVGVHP